MIETEKADKPTRPWTKKDTTITWLGILFACFFKSLAFAFPLVLSIGGSSETLKTVSLLVAIGFALFANVPFITYERDGYRRHLYHREFGILSVALPSIYGYILAISLLIAIALCNWNKEMLVYVFLLAFGQILSLVYLLLMKLFRKKKKTEVNP